MHKSPVSEVTQKQPYQKHCSGNRNYADGGNVYVALYHQHESDGLLAAFYHEAGGNQSSCRF